MTLQKIFVKQFGKDEFEKLPRRLKKLLLSIDSLSIGKKPVSRRELEKALA